MRSWKFERFARMALLPAACLCISPGNRQFAQATSHPTQEPKKQNAPAAQPGRVTGRVLRSDTARPLAKAVVTIWPASQPRESLTVRTDSAGVFLFLEVPPGTYRLRAQRNGFVAQLYGQRGSGPGLTLAVAPGQRVEKVDFRLDPAGVISGTVYDEDREPVEGLQVSALRLRFSPGGRRQASIVRSTQTDDLGNYRLPNLEPGFYFAQAGGRGEGLSIGGQTAAFTYLPAFYPRAATHDDAQRVQVSAGTEARAVDIFVRSGSTFTVSGVVIDSATSSAPRYSVGFARGGATAMMDTRDVSFTLRGLAPGDYTLIAAVAEEGKPTRRGYLTVKVVDSDLRVGIEIGRTAEVRGKAQIEDGQPFSFSGLRVNLMPENEDAVFSGSALAEEGHFTVRNLPNGEYYFELFGRTEEVYLKQVRCAGQDYTAKPLALETAQVLDDCALLLSRDIGEVSGRVSQDEKPVSGFVVVLVPKEPERRRIPRHTIVAQTDANGQFHIRGVIPGDYLAFAVPPSDDAVYYDLEFAERNRESAEPLDVKAKEPYSLALKPTRPK